MLRAVCTLVKAQGLKESRLTIRGDEDQGLVSSEKVWTHTPHRLVRQSATLLERSIQSCRRANHKTYRPFDDHWSYFRHRSRLTIFEIHKTKKMRLWPSLVCRLDHRSKPVEIFLQKHILETIVHQIWTKARSMAWRTFQSAKEWKIV